MKTIKIRVPNKSFSKEWEVLDAVDKLLNKMEKNPDISIRRGQGGNLDDWKEPDLGGEKEGLLMVVRVSLKGKEAIKESNRYYIKALKDYNNVINKYKKENYPRIQIFYAKMYLESAKKLLKQA